ncbi:hypothetical protein [Chitinophaga solisilvae]|uniref:hypothetical protein n=1 Tax=Chitinophaga solisilvae TaxID=1233460 RepID=UPI00136F5A31|nr:hypothetical protein [Chitinophaga solisilvae]
MKRSQVILFTFSCLLAVSVFLPLINIPFIGAVNYFKNGKGDGTIVLSLAVIAAVMSFTRFTKWVLIPGVVALGMAGTFLIRFNQHIGSIPSATNAGVLGDLANTLVSSISIGYGFVIMGIAAAGLTFLPPFLVQHDKEI